MTTRNMDSEAGVRDIARGLSLDGFDLDATADQLHGRLRHVIDDDELAELVHDIRNTIGAVSMLSELTALELAEDSGLHAITRNVQNACQDVGAQCGRVLDALHGSPVRTEPTDLSALVRGMAPLLATWMPPASVLRFNLDNALPPLELTPNDIRRVVMNLVKNAAEAVSERPGIVTVSTGWLDLGGTGASDSDRSTREAGVRQLCLAVSDTGCGMDEATRVRMQMEHYSSKSNGHGLGLASVRRIVAAHGARLRITSHVGAGTTVRVVFAEQASLEDDAPLSIHDASEPSVPMEEILVLPLRQVAAPVQREAASVRTTGAQRLRLCGAESMAGEIQHLKRSRWTHPE